MYRSRRFGAEPVNVDEKASPADPVRQPELAKFVDERKRVFSVGLDPGVEQTAAEWFESLGYATLTGSVHYTKGFWGGVKTEADPRLGVSVCTGTGRDLVDGYDFANWLPIPRWWTRWCSITRMPSFCSSRRTSTTGFVASPSRRRRRRGSAPSADASARTRAEFVLPVPSAAIRHAPLLRLVSVPVVLDYPDAKFATREVDPLAWREAYVNHVAKVKTSVPSERLLVVPMLADQSPVAVAQAVGSFVELTAALVEFAAAHPFEPHIMDLRREQGWSVVLFIAVGVLGLALLFVPNPYAGARQSGYSSDFSH